MSSNLVSCLTRSLRRTISLERHQIMKKMKNNQSQSLCNSQSSKPKRTMMDSLSLQIRMTRESTCFLKREILTLIESNTSQSLYPMRYLKTTSPCQRLKILKRIMDDGRCTSSISTAETFSYLQSITLRPNLPHRNRKSLYLWTTSQRCKASNSLHSKVRF